MVPDSSRLLTRLCRHEPAAPALFAETRLCTQEPAVPALLDELLAIVKSLGRLAAVAKQRTEVMKAQLRRPPILRLTPSHFNPFPLPAAAPPPPPHTQPQ